MKLVSVAIAASLLASTPALAQNFTGPRAEVRLGLDVLGDKYDYTSKWEDTYYNYSDSYSDTERTAKTGLNYGLGLGYDIAAGKNFIVGVEANLDFSDAKACEESDDDELCLKAGRDIEVGVRGGFIVNPNTLLYAKIGYANGRLKVTGDKDLVDEVKEEYGSRAKNLDGLRLGAGVETVLSKNLYLKVEYTYTDYKSVKFADSGSDGYGYKWSYTEAHNFDRHKVVAGLGVRF